MITCPTCRYPVNLAGAVVITIEGEGVRGERATCPTCGTIFTVTVRIIQDSAFSNKVLEKLRNQPRG